MPRSPFSTRLRPQTLLDRYLAEPVLYGGELWTRGDVIRDLKRCGLDDRSVDRYLQGSELFHKLELSWRASKPLTSLIQ